MSTRSVLKGRTFLSGILGVLVVLGGCGGAESAEDTTTTSLVSTTTTTTAPTTTTTLPPTTTTTLDDQGVVDAFIANITDPSLTARASLTIDVLFDDLEVSGEGEAEFSGADSHMSIEFPGLPARETLTIGEEQYERSGDGPWTIDREAGDPFAEPGEPSDAPLEDLEILAFLQTLGDLEHQATVDQAGQTLHRIGLPEGQEPDPLAFGFEPGETGLLDVSFLATSTGLPHEFWLQVEDLSDPETPTTVTMTLQFTEFGIPLTMAPPEVVWLTHISESGYSISHPSDWEVEDLSNADYGEDRFYGLQGEELAVFTTYVDPPGRVPLNSLLDAFRTAVQQEPGAEMDAAEDYELGGFPARRMTYTYTDSFGTTYAIYVVTQTDPGTIFEFIMFGDSASKTATDDLLEDFLSTFSTG